MPRRPLAATLAALCLCLTTASSAVAQPAAATELWTGTSRYYTLHTDVSREDAQRWGAHMDIVYAAYEQFFARLRPREAQQQRMNLYLLQTRAGYLQTLASLGIDGTGSGGMFFRRGNASGLATYLGDRDAGEVQSVLQHEGLHQFAARYFGNELPLWANEGLAEYFGYALVVDGQLRRGIAPPHVVERVRAAVTGGQDIPFADLITITSDRWRANLISGGSEGGLQYAQSWSVVHFLIHADDGRYATAFSNYLTALTRGQRHQTAYAEAFGQGSEETFGQRWRAYVQEGLEPDHFSQAVERLGFLARGIAWLDAQGDPAARADLEAVIERLASVGYAVTMHLGDGRTRTLAATDDDLLQFTNDRGFTVPFTQRPAAGDRRPPPRRNQSTSRDRVLTGPSATRENAAPAADAPAAALPDEILAPGLQPTPRVTWSRNDAGELSFEVSYTRR